MTCAVSVVIPAYCEAENLRELVPRLAEVLETAGLPAEILVVDDDSPDGTPEVGRELEQRFPFRLLVRKNERGLSSAVMHGMDAATGEVLVVMDADMSHPPEKVPELVRRLDDESVDFVIGSRYVRGGGTDEDWGVYRWLNSKVATLLARPLTSACDPMAGFFAIRRDTTRSASLDPVGYKIGLELIVKCGCRSVSEVPIHFRDRQHGESKMNLREQLNYLRHLGRLYRFRLFGSRGRPSGQAVENGG